MLFTQYTTLQRKFGTVQILWTEFEYRDSGFVFELHQNRLRKRSRLGQREPEKSDGYREKERHSSVLSEFNRSSVTSEPV